MESSKDMLTYIFACLPLWPHFASIQVTKVESDEAKESQVRSFPATRLSDNRIKLLHTLKRDGQKWKIFSSEALMIEYLKY